MGGGLEEAAFLNGDRSPSRPTVRRPGVLPAASLGTVMRTVTFLLAVAAAAACSLSAAANPLSSAFSASGISPCTTMVV